MKRFVKRALAMLLCGVMLMTMMSACGKQEETPAPTPQTSTTKKPTATVKGTTLANGTIDTREKEVGSEKELTAVRNALIKKTEIEGLGTIDKLEWYENGVRQKGTQLVKPRDNKKFYWSGDIKRVVNYPDGYTLDIPQDWTPDFAMSSVYSRYMTDEVTLSVTNESLHLYNYSGQEYIDAMFRFINTDNYQKKNNVKKTFEETTDLGEYQQYVLKMNIEDMDDDALSYYTYVIQYNETRLVHMMFKCVDDRDFADVYNTLEFIPVNGTGTDHIEYPCIDNPSWSKETKKLYDSIMNRDDVLWGLAYGNIEDDCVTRKYPKLEKKVEHTFELVSTYSDTFERGFSTTNAKKVEKKGRFLQFTPHFMYNWGEAPGDKAFIMEVYRGNMDEEIRQMAKDIVKFGQPMLLRVNNEMNSDWTVWGAINTMLDPEIFTETWTRMYEIFKEEGANKYCIWVWNPQSEHSFPNTKWNEIRLYMPGSNYVDMIGLTAYNFGTAYQWNTFEQLYDPIQEVFGKHFGDWGWIISEFGCSDADKENQPERKAQWITDMFNCFEQKKYPNIKAAVWFNGNDLNPDGSILNEIMLNDDEYAIEAFKEGINRTTKQK